MSSREPLWYCHECHAEMRPLMMPDPHCASCSGTFVEKLENPADDPRDFQDAAYEDEPLGDERFLLSLQNMLQGARPNPPRTGTGNSPRPPGVSGDFTIHINRSSNGTGSRMVISGSPSRPGGSDRTGQIPTLNEFVAQQSGRAPGGTIDGPLMLQYLLAMLQQQPGGRGDALFDVLGGPTSEGGRWGDYVFNQEALDQIISQIMENSQAHPVPATDDIMGKLPREVLEEGSPLLERDCAICKDQFSLTTEDPDEQVIVTLPCKHPFHEPCIMPWLKSSGTCPVCRYQLIPQPEHHAPGPGSPSGSSGDSNSSGNNGQRSPGSGGNNGAGFLGGLFHILGGAGPSGPRAPAGPSNVTNNNPNTTGARNSTSRPQSRSSRRGSNDDAHGLPGGWNDVE